ncbi:hypothetical protein [Actinacidiphila soli]|uniref:hypothetical protein n=1 Tax=Actinacidiphila soli TaxID=2487275 RepID=UPI001F0C4335|nr:hypothetical protein [Actinacidiphila soli]
MRGPNGEGAGAHGEAAMVGEAVLSELGADGVDVSYAEVDPQAPTGLLLRDSLAVPFDLKMRHKLGGAASNGGRPSGSCRRRQTWCSRAPMSWSC